MDMFMDKLAQKLNAQEIIRANAAADAEEMNKLKNQIAEYNDCLTKLQKLIEEGTAALQNAEAGSEDIHRITEEAIGKIQAIQQNNAGLEQVSGQLTERLEHLETEMGKKLEEVSRQLSSPSEEGLAEKFAAVNENTHKECVKVYRNVQAVVVEESGKQTEAAENVSKTVNALGGKVSAILGISVAALVFSLAGVVLQILNALNIQLF